MSIWPFARPKTNPQFLYIEDVWRHLGFPETFPDNFVDGLSFARVKDGFISSFEGQRRFYSPTETFDLGPDPRYAEAG